MSHEYWLTCLQCHRAIDIGKLVKYDHSGRELSDWHMGGNPWRELEQGFPIKPLMARLERFIILHRGHKMIVLPSDLVSELRDRWSMSIHVGLMNHDEVMATPINPVPSEDDDKQIGQDVLDILKGWGIPDS